MKTRTQIIYTTLTAISIATVTSLGFTASALPLNGQPVHAPYSDVNPGGPNDPAPTTDSSTTTPTPTTSTSTPQTSPTQKTTQKASLQTIISKGTKEINRRLALLNKLQARISASTKLSASDKTTLSNEVASAIQGLTTLKTQLAGATTLSAAISDAKSIATEYRVYALVAPKVMLVKVADDQQLIESKLTTLEQKLASRISTEQQAGKNVTTLQTELTNMQNEISAAKNISNTMETSVIPLQPTDYNSNHSVLSGDSSQLKTAHADELAAISDAKEIIGSLKST